MREEAPSSLLTHPSSLIMMIRISKTDPRAVIPKYGTPGSAAFDLTVIEDTVVQAGEQALLRTGLVFCLPEDHVMLIFARSSTYRKFGVILANGVGMIDADYCGPEDEVLISVLNPGKENVEIKAGSRVAQAMVIHRPRLQFEQGAPNAGNRGGFGSTGGHGDRGV
jgi:dUTP pyrophosphatase